MIYHLSNNPKYNWCVMTKNVMAEELWVSKQSILSLLNKMIAKWFVEKDDITKHLRTTQIWYNEFVIYGKESLPAVKDDGIENCHFGKESLPELGKESLPNNNIYNNNINNINIIQKSDDFWPTLPFENIPNQKDTECVDVQTVILPEQNTAADFEPKEITKQINSFIKVFQEKCNELGYAYQKDKRERMFAKHILSTKSYWDFVEGIGYDRIWFALWVLENSKWFYKWVCASIPMVYRNYAEIYNKNRNKLGITSRKYTDDEIVKYYFESDESKKKIIETIWRDEVIAARTRRDMAFMATQI